MRKLQDEFVSAASPVMRLLGHSFAVAMGFCGLAIVSLVPIGALRALIWLGLDQPVDILHGLEVLLLVVDVALFGVVFLAGVVVFIVETIALTRRQLMAAWRLDE